MPVHFLHSSKTHLFVGVVVDLTGALHDLQLQLSPPLPSFLASINLANPGHLKKMAIKTHREGKRKRERQRDYQKS